MATGDDYGTSREVFFREYGDALVHGYAAVFAGAGLSRAAGFVDWKGLLTEFAEELGLDLEVESDLVAVAQYHLNAEHQNRTRLHQKLVDEFGDAAHATESHAILSNLPIRTYWTSNYDALIEGALKDAGRKPAVRRNAATLTTAPKGSDADVYKLHGDLSNPETVIITRDDYARYVAQYPGFRDRLRADLTEKTFLFLGFSFADPHLDFILSELKRDLGQNVRPHFAVMRRESRVGRTPKRYRYAVNLQRLRVRDLERYGIKTVLIEEHGDLPALLHQLRLRYLRRQVFVSGAAHDFSPRGRAWIDELAYRLGKRLIEEDLNLVSGFGLGIGSSVVTGALETLYARPQGDIDRRLLLRPFPLAARRRAEVFTKYRTSMLATAGFAIFISGNRQTAAGGVELSPGVREEYDLARAVGAYPLPVGASGWQAQALWAEVEADFNSVFPKGTPRRAWQVLNRATASPEEVVDALTTLIAHLRPR